MKISRIVETTASLGIYQFLKNKYATTPKYVRYLVLGVVLPIVAILVSLWLLWEVLGLLWDILMVIVADIWIFLFFAFIIILFISNL